MSLDCETKLEQTWGEHKNSKQKGLSLWGAVPTTASPRCPSENSKSITEFVYRRINSAVRHWWRLKCTQHKTWFISIYNSAIFLFALRLPASLNGLCPLAPSHLLHLHLSFSLAVRLPHLLPTSFPVSAWVNVLSSSVSVSLSLSLSVRLHTTSHLQHLSISPPALSFTPAARPTFHIVLSRKQICPVSSPQYVNLLAQ